MAETVTVTRSKTKVPPVYSSWQKTTVDWTTGSTNIASDTIQLTGSILEVVSIPNQTNVPSGGYDIELLDIDRSDVDYLNEQCLARSSDAVEFAEPLISSVLPVCVVGDVLFKVSGSVSDAQGQAIFFTKT